MIKRMSLPHLDHTRLAQLGIMLTVILTAVGLRLARLPLITMWSDEYHSFIVSSLPLAEILRGNYTGDLNPPLYFALLHLQRIIFGDSEIAMRSLSLVFAVLSLPLVFALAQSILKAFIPSIAALVLAAFHPMLIYYSVEIRSYSLLILFGLLGFLGCVKIQEGSEHPQVWAILLVFGSCGCLYAHHFGMIVPLSICAFVAVHVIISKRWTKRETLILLSVVLSVLLYLPGLVMLWRQTRALSAGTNLIPLAQSLQVFVFSTDHPPYEQLLAVLAIMALATGMIVLMTQIRRTPAALLVICGIPAGASFAILTNLAGINVINRYLTVALPLVIIAIAATLTEMKWAWQRLINGLGVITIALYTIYGFGFVLNTKWENQQATWKEDWRQLSVVVRNIRNADEPIVIMGWDATPLQYYLGETAMTSFQLEDQLLLHPHPSYLIVMTPNSGTIPVLDSAVLLYEDEIEGVRILRLSVQSGKLEAPATASLKTSPFTSASSGVEFTPIINIWSLWAGKE